MGQSQVDDIRKMKIACGEKPTDKYYDPGRMGHKLVATRDKLVVTEVWGPTLEVSKTSIRRIYSDYTAAGKHRGFYVEWEEEGQVLRMIIYEPTVSWQEMRKRNTKLLSILTELGYEVEYSPEPTAADIVRKI